MHKVALVYSHRHTNRWDEFSMLDQWYGRKWNPHHQVLGLHQILFLYSAPSFHFHLTHCSYQMTRKILYLTLSWVVVQSCLYIHDRMVICHRVPQTTVVISCQELVWLCIECKMPSESKHRAYKRFIKYSVLHDILMNFVVCQTGSCLQEITLTCFCSLKFAQVELAD